MDRKNDLHGFVQDRVQAGDTFELHPHQKAALEWLKHEGRALSIQQLPRTGKCSMPASWNDEWAKMQVTEREIMDAMRNKDLQFKAHLTIVRTLRACETRGKHIEQLALMHESETDPKRKRRLYRKIQVMHKRQEVMG